MPWEPITTVEQLIARRESSIFDFKKIYDLANAAPTRYEIAKDVAAFASAFGGTIVVGAREQNGEAVRLEGVTNPGKLFAEVATALGKHCAPLPRTPEECTVEVSPTDAARLLAPGAAAPLGNVTLVALNVQPDPRGPIGVRPVDAAGNLVDHAFRFPIRVSDQTRFLDPTELPMWMNSHERRIAIQLHRVISSASADGVEVRVFHVVEGYRGYDVVKYPHTEHARMNLVEVNDERAIVRFSKRLDAQGDAVEVPLSYVAAVWQEVADRSWSLALKGTLYPQAQIVSFRFQPYLGGA